MNGLFRIYFHDIYCTTDWKLLCCPCIGLFMTDTIYIRANVKRIAAFGLRRIPPERRNMYPCYVRWSYRYSTVVSYLRWGIFFFFRMLLHGTRVDVIDGAVGILICTAARDRKVRTFQCQMYDDGEKVVKNYLQHSTGQNVQPATHLNRFQKTVRKREYNTHSSICSICMYQVVLLLVHYFLSDRSRIWLWLGRIPDMVKTTSGLPQVGCPVGYCVSPKPNTYYTMNRLVTLLTTARYRGMYVVHTVSIYL